MSKPKSDLWKRLVAEAGAEEDDAIGRAASVAVKQAEAELTGAGFDVPAERAKAAAFLDALESGALDTKTDAETDTETDAEPEPPLPEPPPSAATAVAQDAPPHVSVYPQPHRKRDRPVVLWIAVAATVVVAAGALYAALGQPPVPGPTPPLPSPTTPAPRTPAPPDLVAAADLRHQAAAACDAKQWSVCLAQLDEARAADPDGDETPAVNTLRSRAIAGILEKPKSPVP
jgi:hypothetical protein